MPDMLGRGTKGSRDPRRVFLTASPTGFGLVRGTPSAKLLLLPRGQSAHMGRRVTSPPSHVVVFEAALTYAPLSSQGEQKQNVLTEAGCRG